MQNNKFAVEYICICLVFIFGRRSGSSHFNATVPALKSSFGKHPPPSSSSPLPCNLPASHSLKNISTFWADLCFRVKSIWAELVKTWETREGTIYLVPWPEHWFGFYVVRSFWAPDQIASHVTPGCWSKQSPANWLDTMQSPIISQAPSPAL